jgi:hypothetical protein
VVRIVGHAGRLNQKTAPPLQNLLHHLKFLLTATNHHGVHSPFVFNYVTKCLYAKPEYCHDKSQNILLKSIAYFGAGRIGLPAGKENLKAKLRDEFPSLRFDHGPYDILFTDPSKAQILLSGTSEENKIHNDTLLLIDDIHGNSANLSTWKNIKNHQKVTVTVDLFYCGAVFFRREQAKEHFKIRI